MRRAGVVAVSLDLIEKQLFGGDARIVEMRLCNADRCVEFVIDGPGLPKLDDLGRPVPVRCDITESRRSVSFIPVD